MTGSGPRPPPGRLPTLTEVVRVDEVTAPAPPAATGRVAAAPGTPLTAASPAEAVTPPPGPGSTLAGAVAHGPPPEPSVPSAPAASPSPASSASTASTASTASVIEASGLETVDAAWPEPGSPQAAQLVDEVLDAVQRRIDLLFEYRVREALVPALGRAAELLVRESRDTLAEMLRDVVGKAVAQELAARRRREP